MNIHKAHGSDTFTGDLLMIEEYFGASYAS